MVSNAKCPINLRNRLLKPIGDHFGGFINIFDILTDCDPKRNFWEITQEMKSKFKKILKDKNILILFGLFKTPIPEKFYKNTPKKKSF